MFDVSNNKPKWDLSSVQDICQTPKEKARFIVLALCFWRSYKAEGGSTRWHTGQVLGVTVHLSECGHQLRSEQEKRVLVAYRWICYDYLSAGLNLFPTPVYIWCHLLQISCQILNVFSAVPYGLLHLCAFVRLAQVFCNVFCLSLLWLVNFSLILKIRCKCSLFHETFPKNSLGH